MDSGFLPIGAVPMASLTGAKCAPSRPGRSRRL